MFVSPGGNLLVTETVNFATIGKFPLTALNALTVRKVVRKGTERLEPMRARIVPEVTTGVHRPGAMCACHVQVEPMTGRAQKIVHRVLKDARTEKGGNT